MKVYFRFETVRCLSNVYEHSRNVLKVNNSIFRKYNFPNMATVQVLCPNGRRQNVKITPNSKLLQVMLKLYNHIFLIREKIINLITYNEIILDAKHFCLLFRLFKS